MMVVEHAPMYAVQMQHYGQAQVYDNNYQVQVHNQGMIMHTQSASEVLTNQKRDDIIE